MSFVRSFFKCQSILYDFSKLGGAIGSYNAGIKIPAKALFVGITAREEIALSDGGLGSTFQIGWSGTPGALLTLNPPIIPSPSNNPLQVLSIGRAIIFTISVTPIIAGKVVFDITYIEGKV